jgi:NAD(P)H dehydrogenase (quinone)
MVGGARPSLRCRVLDVVVVHAHPRTDSYNRALFDAATAGLRRSGHTVHTLSLYEEGFAAAMSEAERRAYHEAEPIVSPDVARHAALVKSADALVFVYPTWWFGLPAILKAWMERVMIPGVAFVFDEHRHTVQPALTNVRRLAGVTTYGSSRLAMRLNADGGRRTITRCLRLVCHRRTRTDWLAMYGLDTSTPDQRAAFLARVEREFGAW